MTSQAVYCLSLQIRPPSDETSDTISTDTDRNSSTTPSIDGHPTEITIQDVNQHHHKTTLVPIQQHHHHQLIQQHQTVTVTTASAAAATTPTTHSIGTLQSHPQHHGNIILVRGARTENGQIILQNSHELLNLLNDEDKPILLQHSRFKNATTTSTTTSTVVKQQQNDGTILLQSALKNGQIDGGRGGGGTVLLQSASGKKTATLPEGSIIMQQRVNKNGTVVDGPILLQTLKRLDKSQSILVFRNATNSTATSTITTNSVVSVGGGGGRAKIVAIDDGGDNKTTSAATVTVVQNNKQVNTPLGSDGEPIKLPDNLESLPRADHFPVQRHRWNTNEEIAAILINFDKHSEWQSKEVRTRPKSGSMLLYSRKKVRYRRDGYCWKKRKDGKTTREDHMKLKVQGTECIYGCYVHSAILPTFHRRCYWLLQNPDIVLVHYLNVPYPDDNKMATITPSLALWGDKKEWTKEELVSQLKPMFFSEDDPDATNEIEISKFHTAETVEAIVSQLMEKQRLARQAALVKQLECGCPDSTCADGKSCSHPMRRISAAKTNNEKRQESNNQVSSTTPNVLIGSRLYSRWVDRRGRDQLTEIGNTTTAKQFDGSIHFQVIPTSSQTHTISNQLITRTNSNITQSNNNSSAIINPTNQQLHQQQQHHHQQLSNATNNISNRNHSNNNNNTNNNAISNNNSINNNQISINTSHNNNINNGNTLTAVVAHSNQISLTGNNSGIGGGGGGGSTSDNNLHLTNHDGHNITLSSNQSNHHHHNHHQQQQQQQIHQIHHHQTQQQQQQHQQQTIVDRNVNHRTNIITTNNSGTPIVTSAPPLVLSLSQIQGTSGGLLILNGQQQSFVCQTTSQQQQLHQQQQQQQHHHQQQQTAIRLAKDEQQKIAAANSLSSQCITPNLIPKQEAMDLSASLPNDKQSDRNNSGNGTYETMQFTSGNTSTTNIPIDSAEKTNNGMSKDLHDTMPFFNETLELSQEDIQKTLTANMPLTGADTEEQCVGEINPMDFINNCCDVGDGPSVNEDDVFVNLDAFDMFVEFPELELDAKTNFLHSNDDQSTTTANTIISQTQSDNEKQSDSNNGTNNILNNDSNNEAYNITDYSPEWAYPEGGVKVLVTGPWDPNSNYTVLFDAFPVPTTIVQSGVLRCYCPAHEVGLATLQVACDGYVISNSVIFEYKSPPNVEAPCEGTANDSLYKLSLYNRLESIDGRMQIKTEPKEQPDDAMLFNQPNYEERLVNYCQSLISKQWRSSTSNNSWTTGYKGMTLLHLASALGYSKLVCVMLTWRSENPNVILDTEIDALSQDCQGFTPLMWSCAKGHVEVATILYKWNYNALNVKNRLQQTSTDVARSNGYSTIATELERLDIDREKSNNHSSSFSAIKNTSDRLNHLYGDNNVLIVTTLSSSTSSSTSSSPSNVVYSSSYSAAELSPSNCSDLLSNTNSLDIDASQCSSPMSIGSMSSINSNRSHDGVFLRPGAVSSSQSPPAARLSKRSSVDSGINMDMRNSTTTNRTGKIIREQPLKFSSRYDRSMSLPMANSPNNQESHNDTTSPNAELCINETPKNSYDSGNGSFSIGNISLLSPLRKMDFALCEVSAANSSPISQDQSVSDDDDADINDDRIDQEKMQEGGVVGESDAKVLTLAEQIIAAMPERIKNESVEMMSLGSPITESLNSDSTGIGCLNDSFMEPLLDSLPSSNFDQEFNFEFSDHNYRYHDVGTPCSSLSPASSGPLQSPASYSIAPDPPMNSPSPPPTTQDFTEFLHASSALLKPFESDFSNLTLTDLEQRELYEAAKCIQKAYRSYKGRKKLEEQDKERSAAIVIQNYYRRYKQYAYYRQMTHAALIIQSSYRSYCENKRFKKSQNQSSSTNKLAIQNSQCLQSYYRNYQHEQQQQQNSGSASGGTTSKEPSPSGPLKRTYSQRTQNLAARKIQQFMRQSKLKLQRERAEKEKLVYQHRAEYLQNLPYPVRPGPQFKDQSEKPMNNFWKKLA